MRGANVRWLLVATQHAQLRALASDAILALCGFGLAGSLTLLEPAASLGGADFSFFPPKNEETRSTSVGAALTFRLGGRPPLEVHSRNLRRDWMSSRPWG